MTIHKLKHPSLNIAVIVLSKDLRAVIEAINLKSLGSSFHIVGPAMPKALLRTTIESVKGMLWLDVLDRGFILRLD